ncbi:MAG: tyrS, partial [Polyangiaceae bacterium]|nr:tyrS [Polyangiaceae bacterium]
PDALMESYYQLLTNEPMDEARQRIAASPRDAKIALAKHVITWLHSKEAADAAEDAFVRQFTKKEVPGDMPEFQVGPGPHKLAPLLVRAGLASSNSEAIRKMKEGAVQIDGAKVTDFQSELSLDKPRVLKLGRKFARVTA